MAKTQEITFTLNQDNLMRFISLIKDLSSICEKALLKFDKKNILVYTLVGEGKSINAFKSYIFKTHELFTIDDFDDTINLIIRDTKILFKNLQTLAEFNSIVECKLSYDMFGDMLLSDRLTFKSDKIKLNVYGGDPLTFNANITIKQIKGLTDSENSDFNFVLKSEDFANVKRLSVSDKDNDVFYINVIEQGDKNYVTIGESTWEMTLSEVDYKFPKTMAFPKKFFKTIGNSVNSTVYMFETYLVVSTENSDLLISSEITV